jgi:hypothetical protein
MEYRLGVDLGTTYTAAAVLRGDEPGMVSLGDRDLFAPSVLVLNPDGSVLVGEPAEQRAPRRPAARCASSERGEENPCSKGGRKAESARPSPTPEARRGRRGTAGHRSLTGRPVESLVEHERLRGMRVDELERLGRHGIDEGVGNSRHRDIRTHGRAPSERL